MAGRKKTTPETPDGEKKLDEKVTKPRKPRTSKPKNEDVPVTETNQADDTKEPEKPAEPKPEEMSVSAYFDFVKGMKQETNSENVKNMLDACEQMLEMFEITGQVSAAKKAAMTAKVLKKDLELYDKGITKYVHLDDISKYLDKVQDHSVKIIELRNFPRLIPTEVLMKYMPVKDLFDEAFIVFTDYTEKTEKKDTVAAAMGKTSTAAEVEKKRKEKDPILFGAIKVEEETKSMRGNTYEKLYYIADWVDDYCDLTFDKLVEEMGKHIGTGATEIQPINSLEEFRKVGKF